MAAHDTTPTMTELSHTTAWLSTTASQIFFMQLGFLCYEVGYVKAVWTQSVILKNIEDTFVGVLTFLAFGHTLADSPNSFYGIISVPTNPLLINVDPALHDQILIAAFFASTCATIISGAVLERMKNKAYISWCLLTILVNYSFVAHWVWHPDGWLAQLGFVDGAGSVVVHSTAGMASLVAVWKLGERRDALDADGNLLPTEHAANPIVNAIGAFFLWYGWFAFNVSSPIAFSRGIGDAIGTTALITVISPISSSCAAFVWMHFGYVKLSFESLLSCMISGLVAITGMCHTCNVWEAAIIGATSSVVYFLSAHLIRYKWKLDDPLQVIAIHLFCGVFSGVFEGVVANDVYGTPGIIHANSAAKGFEHFGVQLLGVVVIIVWNFLCSLFLYEVVLKRGMFRNIDMRVSILDIYLGTRLFDQNYDMALDEVLNCTSNVGKQMLFELHHYMADRYAAEQLDFLIVCKIYNHYLERNENVDKTDKYQSAKYILRIVNTYVDENGAHCINVSAKQRQILMRIKHQLLFEIKTDRMEREQKEKEKEKEQKKPNKAEEKPEADGASEALFFSAGDEDDAKEKEKKELKKDKKDGNSNKPSTFLTRFDAPRSGPGLYHSGLDITRENVFHSCYVSVWKLVLPHFTHFLQHTYDIERRPKFEYKIPFKLEKNWIIQYDEQLTKSSEAMQLADTVPQYNNSGTLLSKMLKEYDELNGTPSVKKRRHTPSSRSSPKKRRSSGLAEIQLTQEKHEDGDGVDAEYAPPAVLIADGKTDDATGDGQTAQGNFAVIIE